MANETGAERFWEHAQRVEIPKIMNAVDGDFSDDKLAHRVKLAKVLRRVLTEMLPPLAEAYKGYCTQELSARIAELELFPAQFMVEGGPVVRSSDFAVVKARAEKAEAEVRELKAKLEQISQDGR